MAQLGPVSRGSLGAGQTVKLPMELSGQCVTIVGMAGAGVEDLGLSLADSEGKEVAKDETHGPDGTVRFCADKPGKYALTVAMVAGAGEYVVASWTGGQPGRPAEAATVGATAQAGGGTCESPAALVPGQTYVGDTSDGRASEEGSCGNSNAKELVYRLDLAARQRVTVEIRAQYDGVLYMRKGECADSDGEVECNDDAPGGGRRSRIDRVLEPGVYFVFVDGYGEEEGAFRMTVRADPAGSASNACDGAPQLASFGAVQGVIGEASDMARASCGRDATGPDTVYRLDVPTRSRVRVTERAVGFPPVVHVRRACEDRTSELGCSAEGGAPGRVSWAGVLDAGSYFVFADSAAEAAVGDYTLTTETTADVGQSATGDTCGDAESIPAMSGVLQGDTFNARDDVATTCGGTGGADVVYRLDVLRKSRLVASLEGDEAKHVLSLQRSCGAPSTELACGTSLDTELAPGAYWLIVDNAMPDTFGRFNLTYRVQDLAQIEAACSAAPRILPGQAVKGSTAGAGNRFETSCATTPNALGFPDKVYAFTLAKRTFVTASLTPTSVPAVLSIRRTCGRQASEIGCSLGHPAGSDARLRELLEPGTYYAIVEGLEPSVGGDYSLQIDYRAPTAPRPEE